MGLQFLYYPDGDGCIYMDRQTCMKDTEYQGELINQLNTVTEYLLFTRHCINHAIVI